MDNSKTSVLFLRSCLAETSSRLRNALDNEPGKCATDLVKLNWGRRVALLEREQLQLTKQIRNLMIAETVQAASFVRGEFKL